MFRMTVMGGFPKPWHEKAWHRAAEDLAAELPEDVNAFLRRFVVWVAPASGPVHLEIVQMMDEPTANLFVDVGGSQTLAAAVAPAHAQLRAAAVALLKRFDRSIPEMLKDVAPTNAIDALPPPPLQPLLVARLPKRLSKQQFDDFLADVEAQLAQTKLGAVGSAGRDVAGWTIDVEPKKAESCRKLLEERARAFDYPLTWL